MPYTAKIGSISHGTHRTVDLLEAFADELDRLETDRDDVAQARAILTLENAGWNVIDGDLQDGASELVTTLMDGLNEFAPPYTYFGTHQGDGSDFGFWPDLDAIEELPKVSDPNEVDDMDEDCVFVNDHGNVTVFAANGSVIWDCV